MIDYSFLRKRIRMKDLDLAENEFVLRFLSSYNEPKHLTYKRNYSGEFSLFYTRTILSSIFDIAAANLFF